ncbi:hypothetical protein PINS_up005769 [Pythium insidiosum]|nr:hypothetical protein PINS_up005769 [Pythium insidiosum]
MSVEGVQGVFCVKGQACVANKDGACPGPQNGLPNGSHCGTVKTGVKGCKPGPAPRKHHKKAAEHKQAPQCGKDESPMSVEGVQGVFCVKGQACVANKDGACPGPQNGLPNGSHCGTVKTGVKGCKPGPAPRKHHKKAAEHKQAPQCGKDESPMSVEGVQGVFCVKGQACVADIDGECPTPQKGLEFGAYCDEVKTGVMGCKPYKSWDEWLEDHPEDSEESEEVDDECADDETEMSVEGVEGIFCVPGQACAGSFNGTCPEPQDGLEFGAYCGKVKTGVLGCKPYKSEAERKAGPPKARKH